MGGVLVPDDPPATARRVAAARRGSTPSPPARDTPTPQMVLPARVSCVAAAALYCRHLKLNAKFESGSSHIKFKR